MISKEENCQHKFFFPFPKDMPFYESFPSDPNWSASRATSGWTASPHWRWGLRQNHCHCWSQECHWHCWCQSKRGRKEWRGVETVKIQKNYEAIEASGDEDSDCETADDLIKAIKEFQAQVRCVANKHFNALELLQLSITIFYKICICHPTYSYLVFLILFRSNKFFVLKSIILLNDFRFLQKWIILASPWPRRLSRFLFVWSFNDFIRRKS